MAYILAFVVAVILPVLYLSIIAFMLAEYILESCAIDQYISYLSCVFNLAFLI